MDRQQEFVLRTLEERDIRFVRLWFTDVLGTSSRWRSRRPSSRARSPRASASTVRPSRASPGSTRPTCWPSRTRRPSRSCRGAARPPDRADVLRHHDARRLAVLRRPAQRAEARAREGGRPGFTFYTHPEIEFYLLKACPTTASRRSRRTPAATSTTPRTTPRRLPPARRSRCSRRWASRSSSATTRAGPGQHEIDLRYADALTTADNIMTFRTVVKEVAIEQGVYATFMPKPFAEHPGSACTPTSRSSRATQRVLRGREPVPAVEDRPAVHRRACCATPPRSRR